MTQASLFQYIVPTAGPDAHPLFRITSREWVDRIAGTTIPHTVKPPRVEISNADFHLPGADHLLAFFYCQVDRIGDDDGWTRDDDEIRYPNIMAALYAITAELIADGWWIEHCDIMGRGRRSGRLDPRIIAMRWHEGRVVDSPRWRYITGPYEMKMGEDKVPLRCAEDLVRCGYCNGAGCMFCDHRGVMLERRRRR